jgi:hypothetical protein
MLTLLTFITILGAVAFPTLITLSIIDGKKSEQFFKQTLDNATQFKNIHHHMVRFEFHKSAEL